MAVNAKERKRLDKLIVKYRNDIDKLNKAGAKRDSLLNAGWIRVKLIGEEKYDLRLERLESTITKLESLIKLDEEKVMSAYDKAVKAL